MCKKQNTAVALGFFDGLHLGHMSLIECVIEKAKEKNLTPVIIFFDNHPKKFLTEHPLELIMQNDIKIQRLESLGLKIHHVSFAEIMNYSPSEFFEKILLNELGAKLVVSGENYHFAKGGKGNTEVLKQLCEQNGVDFQEKKLIKIDDTTVSSTLIRTLIKNGNVKKANKLLLTPFTYEFEVFSGDKRGRTLGFPTINQWFEDDFVVPKFGVYCSKVFIGEKQYLGVTNIGIRPSVYTEKMRSETYIDGFEGDLYGKKIRVSLLEFLRDEIKFSSLDQLEKQIKKDLQNAKQSYKNNGEVK